MIWNIGTMDVLGSGLGHCYVEVLWTSSGLVIIDIVTIYPPYPIWFGWVGSVCGEV